MPNELRRRRPTLAWAVVVAFFAVQTVAPAETNRWQHSYSAALKAAEAEGKPVLLSFHADWCGWCKVMDREVFENPRLQGRLDTFVCAKIDIEREPKTALAFEVSSVPRTILLNQHFQVISDTLGYVEAMAFEQILDAAGPDLDRKLPDAMAAPETDALAVSEMVGSFQLTPHSATLPEPVLGYLSHPDPDVRAETRASLAKHKESVVPGLVQALASDYLGTRISAHVLLRELTGQTLPYDPWASTDERLSAQRAWQDSLAGER